MEPYVFDGHNDLLGGLRDDGDRDGASFVAGRPAGHVDLARARAGGMRGGLFAIFVPTPKRRGIAAFGPPPPALDAGYARDEVLARLALALRMERRSAGALEIVRDAAALARCLAAPDGPVACVLHIEGADGIDGELALLWSLHACGLRSLGVVWSRPNAFGAGVPLTDPTQPADHPDCGPGLTDRGRELVRACNELGVLVDLAHITERGFWDVAETTRAPLVVSHTAAHAVAATARNVTDAQIDAVGSSGGLIGLTYYVGDLRPDRTGDADTPLELLAEHLEHIAGRIGVDHVALGSDFDGARVPAAIGDAAGVPALLALLRRRGWDDDALAKLAHGNWVRTLEDAWA